jgi:hypothetical protein
MGTFKQGIYGGYSGKVGNVVGSSWKGIDVMRIMPASVANPQTVPQLTQRQKFSVTMGFLQPISEFLKTGFRNYAVRMTGINAAMSYNIRDAVSGAYPNYTIDYPNVLVSRGSLPAALNPAAAAGAAGKVVFTWDDNSTEIGADASDKSLIVVYNPVKHQAVTANELAERSAATQTVTVPDAWTGDLVQNYLAFINAKGDDLASSRFAGAVTVV